MGSPSSSSSQSSSSSSSTSLSFSTTSSSSTSSTTESVPSIFTYETSIPFTHLDPSISYSDSTIPNVYENLVGYNGSCNSCVIPWLAENYTVSSDLKTYNFTLRSGITFADGEALNSTAVYFSLNRMLINDGSTTVSHGTQAAWLMQQMLNTSLSTNLCCAQSYNSTYVNEVLAENFVQITGPLTFQIHVVTPTAAFPYIMSGFWGEIFAPSYVMQHDIAMWNQNSAGYNLPYPTLTGNETSQIQQYFLDEVTTCNAGATPQGCGETYLDRLNTGLTSRQWTVHYC